MLTGAFCVYTHMALFSVQERNAHTNTHRHTTPTNTQHHTTSHIEKRVKDEERERESREREQRERESSKEMKRKRGQKNANLYCRSFWRT